MKELLKPTDLEQAYTTVEPFAEACGTYCEPPNSCNKHCSGRGTTNESAPAENDILF